jgi:putative SOS response-associated peptidase YedK
MCGRFARIVSDRKLRERYRLKEGTLLKDSYNIAPSQPVAAVRANKGERMLVLRKWGLIPAWAKDATIGHKSINTRSETVAEKPSFARDLRYAGA